MGIQKIRWGMILLIVSMLLVTGYSSANQTCRLNPSFTIAVPERVEIGTRYDLPPIVFSPTNCGDFILTDSNTRLSGDNHFSLDLQTFQPLQIKSITNNKVTISLNADFLPSRIYYVNLIITVPDIEEPFSYPFNIRVISAPDETDPSLINSGTNLKFIFSPPLSQIKPGQEVIIQLADNTTSNLVDNHMVFLNSVLLNSSDIYTYKVLIETNKNYSFRGKSPGYIDVVTDFRITSVPINISITPEDINEATTMKIETDVNASLFLDERKVNNPYTGYLSYGNHTIKAIAEGFLETEKVIFVEYGNTPTLLTEWKKGVEQVFSFPKNVSYVLFYKSDSLSLEEETIKMGTSDSVSFKPTKKGFYYIKVDEKTLWEMELKGFNWNSKWWFMAWYWWVALVILIGGFMYLMNSNSKSSSPSMGGMINYS